MKALAPHRKGVDISTCRRHERNKSKRTSTEDETSDAHTANPPTCDCVSLRVQMAEDVVPSKSSTKIDGLSFFVVLDVGKARHGDVDTGR